MKKNNAKTECREKRAMVIGAGDFAEEAFLRELASLSAGGACGTGSPAGESPVCPAVEADGTFMIIAADAGLRRLEKLGIRPDLIVGDFDSLGQVPEAHSGVETVVLQVHKDDTDMEAACELAWERGFRKLRVFGGSGSRPDHFLGNLNLLARCAGRGGDIRLIAPGFTVYALAGGAELLLGRKEDSASENAAADPKDAKQEPAGEIFDRISGSCPAAGTTFSVLPHGGPAEGVTIGGDVEYPLTDAELPDDCTLGVSNRTTGPDVRISVRRGILLVFVYDSPEAAE